MSDSEPENEDLKVKRKPISDSGKEAAFILKDTDQFSRLFRAYEKVCNVEKNTYKFLANEKILLSDGTPKMMEWAAGKRFTVEAALAMEGGMSPSASWCGH
ncbi:hypothetical protein I317_01826 [Kwoniella heveanensis CBS 569]|nr:hypothetical protein I317_01826 [Kwoniella heveanensis CBS 569]